MRDTHIRWLGLAATLFAAAAAVAAPPTIVAPDASGTLRADGTLAAGPHGIATSAWNATSRRYEIGFTGHDYGSGDVSVVNLLGDAGNCPGGATARVGHLGGRLLVFVVAADGELIDCPFGLTSFFASSRAGITTPFDNAYAPHAPIAIGTVQRSGVLGDAAFGIDAATWNASLQRYEIDIAGHAYSIYDVPAVALSGDAASCPAGAVIRHSSVSGKLLVFVLDAAGAQIQCPFQFFVYPAKLDYLLLGDGFEGDVRPGTRLPAAYAYINSFALEDIRHPHRVGSALWNAAQQRFEIAIDGVHVGPSDRAVVNISGGTGSCPAGSVARYGSVDGLLLVYIVEPGGTRRQCGFRFVLQDG